MKNFCLGLMAVLIANSIVVAAPVADGPEQVFKGKVGIVSVGGVETPRRRAFEIGTERFEVSGDHAAVGTLALLAGHTVEVRGQVRHQSAVGGECYPLLVLSRVVDADAGGHHLDPALMAKVLANNGDLFTVAIRLSRTGALQPVEVRANLGRVLSTLAADGEHVEGLKTGKTGGEMYLRASPRVISDLANRDEVEWIRGL